MASEAKSKRSSFPIYRSLDVLIVGAGFAGLYQLHSLRKLDLHCKVVDNAGGLGGTWYWNCYPGARVDSENPVYQYSFDDLYKDWTFSERFPALPEIRRYFQYVDEKLDLSRDVELNKEVKSAYFDTESGRWHVSLDTGEVIDCQFFIPCIGFSAKIYIPDFKGLNTFKGVIHHTARYPQNGLDLKGKRVAIVGTGASGVQCIQEIGPIAKHLTVFQRTPNLCIPAVQRKLDPQIEERLKNEGGYEKIFKRRCETFSGFHYDWNNKSGHQVDAEEMRKLYEEIWAYGGLRFWVGLYIDTLFDKKINDTVYAFWAEKTRARISNPMKRDILAPLLEKQPHTFGTKRPSLEQNYYEVCDRDNVNIISLKQTPIGAITENGIKMSDGFERPFDVIILATGFDNVTGPLRQIDIKGTDSVSLAEKWSKGTSTFLGMTTTNFPNMFFIYGPHGPTSFSNGPSSIELQCDWVTNAIDFCYKNKKKTMDATAESEAKWTAHVAELTNITLLAATESAYMGDNIPAKPREALNYAGGVQRYMMECNEVAEKGYEGFVFDAPYGPNAKA